ncbi:MAG TPA: AAA family ATPase, partial [Xanthomonadales bacterium]|nr:AAA family ATPase [Xanthomonadales bacterium]
MTDLARRAAAGEAAVAFVSGDAGAGKTRLVEELGRHLPRGMRSYRGACLEYAPSPLGPVVDILAELDADNGAHAAGARFAAPTGDDPVDKRRLFERVATTLQTAGARAPLAVVIDDAHWADSATLDLVQFLITTLRGARVLLVPAAFTLATTRDHWEVLLRARAIE